MEDAELTRPPITTHNSNGIDSTSGSLGGKVTNKSTINSSNKVSVRNRIYASVWEGIKSTGMRIFTGMEYVGEIVAHLIGLDQSRFQYVIDSMTEEDWARAREIHLRRQEERKNYDTNKEANAMEGGQK